MSSPTQRSLDYLRKQGYTCQVVERWNPYGRVRVDLFGFIDIVGIKKGYTGVLGIQTTTRKNISARVLKIKREPVSKVWLLASNRIIVHGWEKNKLGKWDLYEEAITLDNISTI